MTQQRLAGLPRGVWALGLVSLCMDLSSELIHALLPLYLAVALGASTITIGVLEGVAEATALVTKVFSGVLSDRFGRRKPLVVLGYGVAALTKFVFPLAPTLGWVVFARLADRVGKGIRGAPRDALIADLTPAKVRGAAFGLRQALDTVGAVLGPLAALAAMSVFVSDFRAAFWVAVVPAALAVILLIVGVHEPDRPRSADAAPRRLDWSAWRLLGRDFAALTVIAAVLTLARFSEAFLILRAQNVGVPVAQAPLVMVFMSLVYALTAYPTGRAVDRGFAPQLMSAGLAALVAADLLLAFAAGAVMVYSGAALWGLHMGLTQGLLSALVAGSAPAHLRGTAFGVFNLASGVALLIASALAGVLWAGMGPGATFLAGALFTALAWAALLRHGMQALGREAQG